MQSPDTKDEVVFQTPWFQVSAKKWPGVEHPYYAISAPDFVAIVAVNAEGHLLLVRQFRHVAGRMTLELPAGHVEIGETPEQAARKELAEETGHEADTFELLTVLAPSTARFTNRLWCFYAGNARPAANVQIEAGMQPVIYTQGLRALLDEKDFITSGSCAALFAALVRGKMSL
jgi:ADP-ribose pyrophosphatase YjhB (NUDIX family)